MVLIYMKKTPKLTLRIIRYGRTDGPTIINENKLRLSKLSPLYNLKMLFTQNANQK